MATVNRSNCCAPLLRCRSREFRRTAASSLTVRPKRDRTIYVRAFNPTGADLPAAISGPWQVSNNEGAEGMIVWRRDGAELGYIGADRGVKAVPVSMARAFESGRPRTLFTLPDANERPELGPLGSIARDGQRVVVSIPLTTQRRQMTVFDRQGNVLSKVGEPCSCMTRRWHSHRTAREWRRKGPIRGRATWTPGRSMSPRAKARPSRMMLRSSGHPSGLRTAGTWPTLSRRLRDCGVYRKPGIDRAARS